MTPLITRWQRRTTIFLCVVMGTWLLSISLPWYCRDWTARTFGWDIFTATQEGSILLDWGVPIVMVLMVVPSVLLRRWVSRQKQAVADGKRPCLYCLYDLQGHEPSGTCPECGEAFDIAQIERYFMKL